MAQEKNAIYHSLKRRAEMLVEGLNAMEVKRSSPTAPIEHAAAAA